MKVCKGCAINKPLDQFYAEPRNCDGYTGKCRACMLDQSKRWGKDNPDKRLKRERRWRKANIQRRKDLDRAYIQRNLSALRERTRKRRKDHPERFAARSAVWGGLANGSIVRPDRCSSCDAVGKVQAHHPDYAKPLLIEWLCRRCHYYADVALGFTPGPRQLD